MVIIKLIKYICSLFYINETKKTINPIVTNQVISAIKPSKNNQNTQNSVNNSVSKKPLDELIKTLDEKYNDNFQKKIIKDTNNKSNKNYLSDDIKEFLSGADNIPPRWL